MSNNLTSSYTLNLLVKDDKTKDAVRKLEKDLHKLGQTVDKVSIGSSLTKNLNETQDAAQSIIDKFHELARNQDLDFATISKTYSRNAGKAIAELENQYAKQKDLLDEVRQRHDKLQERIEAHKRGIADANLSEEAQAVIKKRIQRLEEEQTNLGLERLQSQVQQNRQIRANLKAAEMQAKYDLAVSKQKAKLEDLAQKRQTASTRSEKKDLDLLLKQEKMRLKLMQQVTKEQIANGDAIKLATKQVEQLESKWDKVKRGISFLNKALQTTSNAVNVARGLNEYKDRALNRARTAVQGGIGMARGIASGVSMVTGAADNEVERERQAGRVKGYSREDAQGLLSELYVNTGADYAAIVDAINRVQNTLGRNLKREELTQAAELELRYPGLSLAYASQSGTNAAGAGGYLQYATKLDAIQRLTGASADQIAASTQLFANRKDIKMAGGSVSDYQAVYLAMQNSGAFENEEELDHVFNQFVKSQSRSGQSVFEFAKNFKMADHVRGERNYLQAQNADNNMDWGAFERDLKANEGKERVQSEAEQTARKMRELEEQKNKLLIKLMPSAMKIVEALVEVLSGDEAKKLVEGLVEFFNGVAPLLKPIAVMLTTVLKWFNETIMPWVQDIINGSVNALMDFGTSIRDKFKGSTSKNANGGIVWGTSIVGERGPEAIIPLDYSRAQRAENIAYSIQNNFSMSGNETTALSLAQAVSSRDFSRAMGKAAFKAGRLGAF